MSLQAFRLLSTIENAARLSIHGFSLPPMRPTTTISSLSLPALRASITDFAPLGSLASRNFAPSADAADAVFDFCGADALLLQPTITPTTRERPAATEIHF